MIYQNDPDALPEFKKYGCYYFSWLKAMFDRFPELGELTMDKAKAFFKKQVDDPEVEIGRDCMMIDPQDLCDDLVGTGKVKFMGKLSAAYVCKSNEFAIQLWVTPQGNTHFTLPDYDPWKPASPWRINGKLSGTRVFRVL